MQLKEFNLISPVIESSHVFKAIETAIPIEVIEQTIGDTEVREVRKRKLPSSLVVCLVIAMSLWSNDSMSCVLKNLVNGLSREWARLGRDQIPVPQHHQRVPDLLNAIAAIGGILVIWGLVVLSIWGVVSGYTLMTLGKLWYLDRMVWLYGEMKDVNSEYRSWLY